MIRVHTLQVQARITCDHHGCHAVIQAPARPPSLTADETDLTGLTLSAPYLGWDTTEPGVHYCPTHRKDTL